MIGQDDKLVRIGGASAAWGDSAVAVPQLLQVPGLDFLVFDYLAEMTMSILAAAQMKRPELGYATDFITMAMAPNLEAIAENGVRVIANAGGLNPAGCAAALEKLISDKGLALKVATIEGDDVLEILRRDGVRDADKLLTANAYLGALPIKAALDAGADIVVTGRCVDSAVTLGALMHAFGWADDAYDLLAQGSLAGHIIECGAQATGGLFTDWQDVPDWANIGYPVIECRADGAFTVTKPDNTGGLVSPPVVLEQMLYEIGDPRAYMLPDVICDFANVKITLSGESRVTVSGAKGRPPPADYKVTATLQDGFRCTGQLTILGFDAAAKARRTAQAILERSAAMFERFGLAGYRSSHVEILGAETAFGPHAAATDSREVVMLLTVFHERREALDIFAREIAPAGTSFSPGTTGATGRPRPVPLIRQVPFMIAKDRLTPCLCMGSQSRDIAVPPGTGTDNPPPAPTYGPAPAHDGEWVERPLIAFAHGRSGDKGNAVNIGIIARRPEFAPFLAAQLTADRVQTWLAHLVDGPVIRHDLPELAAFNFVCEQALAGGGMASPRNDPWGKGFAQILLSLPVKMPAALVA